MLSSLHPSVDRESGAGHRLHPGPMKSEAGQDLYQQLQQKQQGRSVGQDLFLDLALHELDAANGKPSTLSFRKNGYSQLRRVPPLMCPSHGSQTRLLRACLQIVDILLNIIHE